MVWKGLEGISPEKNMECVVIIREHNGFGCDENSLVIDMSSKRRKDTYQCAKAESLLSKVVPRPRPGVLI